MNSGDVGSKVGASNERQHIARAAGQLVGVKRGHKSRLNQWLSNVYDYILASD